MPTLSLDRKKTLLEEIKKEKEKKPKNFIDWILWLREKGRLPVSRKARAEMSIEDVLLRWPLITAHMICESLGYATPDCAARIVLDAANGHENYCEWICSCFNKNAAKALRVAITTRKAHTGFMADIQQAQALVLKTLIHGRSHDMFSSWS